MKLPEAECRTRLAAARVAHLATASRSGQPHLIPITFALVGDHLLTAIDHKPKSTWNLRRLRNIAENPAVSILCDHYSEDWTHLWWIRTDGTAQILAPGNDLTPLIAKYPQYQTTPPTGPIITITLTTWTGWTAHPTP